MKMLQKENIKYQKEKEIEKNNEKINEIKKYYENIIKEKNENELKLKDIINKNEEEIKNYEFLLKDFRENDEKVIKENKNKIKEINDEAIPIDLYIAMSKSSYLQYNINYIHDFLSNKIINNNNAKIYFLYKAEEKIFVIEYKLSALIVEKIYNINLLIHIPKFYPDSPPEFYIEKRPKISINPKYINGKIDPKTFKINIEKFCKFQPEKNNIEEIINILRDEFNEDFPCFKDKDNKSSGIIGKNILNKKEVNIIIK